MRKSVKLGLAFFAMALLTLSLFLHASRVSAQSAASISQRDSGSHGDWTLTSLNVKGTRSTTNVATFWDSTGTNGFRISPTLAAPQVIISNTVLTGIAVTNIVLTNTAGTTRVLLFRNGLLIGVN